MCAEWPERSLGSDAMYVGNRDLNYNGNVSVKKILNIKHGKDELRYNQPTAPKSVFDQFFGI